MAKKKDLVQIIRDNPGCVVIVDNDNWQLYKEHPDNEPEDASENERWHEKNELARDTNIEPIDGGGCCHGQDVLAALAVIVGITVEPC